MKIILSFIAMIATTTFANAQSFESIYGSGSNSRSNQVNGYYNNRGTYVESYRRTNPNNTTNDNYNTRGNYNPYNGQYGRE